MNLIKITILAFAFSLSGCAYSFVPTQKIQQLQDLSDELKEQDSILKERQTAYEAQGNKVASLQVSSTRQAYKQIRKVQGGVTGSARSVEQLPALVMKQAAPFIPAPYGGIVDTIGSLIMLGATAYGTHKGVKRLGRGKRIGEAVRQVKGSNVGGLGQFNPCDPAIVEAMRLTLDKEDFEAWKKQHGCI